ncbi:enoyl-CoA hydratase [Microvirga aerophila]|uniref:Enoyl-CoA hydratase domain-containing protein 3, mitochondrial n=1 Tax=Microvirga aerophila TaxID=670291 RepID=A0A512BYV8_9HYPH|nr:enoyl-CoA hydratase [Microvirga aerophila]GEO17144.1 enoyl-CoA hydratase [Microvirga aerophila]
MSLQYAASNDNILLREDLDGVVTLTLNRPAQFNALSEEMLAALQSALDDLAADESVRCVVLAAAGRAFCAGHDLKQMRANPRQDYYEALFAGCSRVMQGIVNLPVPVIARVHGMATAAGCQLVASCDLAVAAESATFAVSGINVGLFCSTPAVALSRNVSPKHAFDMLVTGRFILAADALSYGLISRMAPDDELDAAVASLTADICSKSPVAIRTGKAMFSRQRAMSLEDAYAYAGGVMACNMMAEDAAEGIDAFIGKRKPTWKGR